MLKTWQLARFKSVSQETSLTFAPLTLFAGANSAGKSTILQSILLTAQTVQSTLQSRAVILNGNIARLGAFRDVVSNNASEPTIRIGFELDIAPGVFKERIPRMMRGRLVRPLPRRGMEEPLQVLCNFSFSASGASGQSEALQLQPELEHCMVSAWLSSGDEDVERLEFKRRRESVHDHAHELGVSEEAQGQAMLDTLRWEVIERKGDLPPFAAVRGGKDAGVSVNHFLPVAVSIVYDAVEEEVRNTVTLLTAPERRMLDPRREQLSDLPEGVQTVIYEAVLEVAKEFEASSLEPRQALESELGPWVEKLRSAGPDGFMTALARLQRDVPAPVQVAIGNRLLEKKEVLRELVRAGRSPRMEMRYAPLPETLGSAVEAVQQYFSDSVRYLGPLRDEPKPIYPLSAASDTRDVGFRGEHTAAVLDVHSRTEIRFLPAPSDGPSIDSPQRIPLLDAVLHWLRYMGVGSNVKTQDQGKLGHDLRIAAAGSGALHDLTHVGVGVSQVLPILVLSLLAEPGATLIFEQPELHLHPRVQTRLADFFVAMTQLGKQCIVETHSEYLINRLRYRAAASEGAALANTLVMYFVENSLGESVYREVRINEYGVIEDWPRGFFDENEDVAAEILRAGMRKRREHSRGTDA